MRTVLVALLVLSAATMLVVETPPANAVCPVIIGGDVIEQIIVNCVPVAGPIAWQVLCGDEHVCL